jgi:hypothetical protein
VTRGSTRVTEACYGLFLRNARTEATIRRSKKTWEDGLMRYAAKKGSSAQDPRTYSPCTDLTERVWSSAVNSGSVDSAGIAVRASIEALECDHCHFTISCTSTMVSTAKRAGSWSHDHQPRQLQKSGRDSYRCRKKATTCRCRQDLRRQSSFVG